jgi:transglutaminase-like putative cysteine protease
MTSGQLVMRLTNITLHTVDFRAMPKFKIQHITKYTYEVPVRDSANQIMLYPVSDAHQEILLQQLFVTGNPQIERHTDYFNNEIGTFTHSQPHKELIIDSKLEVATVRKAAPEDITSAAEQWAELQTMRYQIPFIDFLRTEPSNALQQIHDIMKAMHNDSHTPLKSALNFCSYVFENFTYKKGITTVDTTVDEIWNIKSGVCQDFAHILLTMLRLIHIPARYVSGYICPNKNGMRGEGATHAWVEAYIPSYGWLGLDPTNNCIADDNHVRLAVGKNYYDCSPVRGTYRGTSNHTLEVAVTVSYEDGNTALPDSGYPEPILSESKNSFRRHQEMQQQQ